MASFFSALLFVVLMTSAYAEPVSVPDPETWYRDGYAPLWEADPAGNTDTMIGYYAASVESRSADGTIATISAHDFIAVPIDGWLADGWLDSKLKDLHVERINETTTSFKASWIDRYDGALDELSCGWYLADFMDGAWQFTAYADLDCGAHGFRLHDS
ncbi:MAG: hypothetical protein OXF72_04180 [Gammaproteobacteria bacterium]|nr:hypothetical protein [Gammaproteobacteria bacterium]